MLIFRSLFYDTCTWKIYRSLCVGTGQRAISRKKGRSATGSPPHQSSIVPTPISFGTPSNFLYLVFFSSLSLPAFHNMPHGGALRRVKLLALFTTVCSRFFLLFSFSSRSLRDKRFNSIEAMPEQLKPTRPRAISTPQQPFGKILYIVYYYILVCHVSRASIPR